ncbi:MAG: response regulator [Polyangiaceae bacterium]|nr:response regulator [Polyangiaceae bacterium]
MTPLSADEGRATYDVLVVDDDVAVLETTMALLEMEHSVEGTTKPRKALDLLQDKPFHVLVVDWQMPEVDGIELFRMASRIHAPIAGLLMTGYVNEFMIEIKPENRRMLSFLAKPFGTKQLLERVTMLGRLSAMKMQTQRIRDTSH